MTTKLLFRRADSSSSRQHKISTTLGNLRQLTPNSVDFSGFSNEIKAKHKRNETSQANFPFRNKNYRTSVRKFKKAKRVNPQAKDQEKPGYTYFEELMMKNSEKLRKVVWNTQEMQKSKPFVAISADFIINQDSFWEQTVNQDLPKVATLSFGKNLPKQWNQLHKLFNVVWIIRRENSYQKLKYYCNLHGCPLYAVFYIKKRRKFTVDYTLLYTKVDNFLGAETENTFIESKLSTSLNLPPAPRITILELLKVNTKDICESSSYEGRVPVLLTGAARVCYLRVEQSFPSLSKAISICQDITKIDQSAGRIACQFSLQKLTSIPHFIADSIRNIQNTNIEMQSIPMYIKTPINNYEEVEEEEDEEAIEMEIQVLKKSMIQNLIDCKGRHYRFEEGQTIHYFVGDIIKRNYELLYERIRDRRKDQVRKSRLSIPQKTRNCAIHFDSFNTTDTVKDQGEDLHLKTIGSQLRLTTSYYQYF